MQGRSRRQEQAAVLAQKARSNQFPDRSLEPTADRGLRLRPGRERPIYVTKIARGAAWHNVLCNSARLKTFLQS